METYIEDSLAAGFICPSASPAGEGFFFVEKKDKTLRQHLGDEPLPLISLAFELLQGATVLSKLDLRNAYHLVQIREGTSGRMPSTRPAATTSIWSCHYEYHAF